MDKSIFMKEIKDLFKKLNSPEKIYSKAWLSEIDFGGLYFSDQYILNVKMEKHINRYSIEIRRLFALLQQNLSKECNELIYSVTIHNDDERIWHENRDIILYDDSFLNAA